MSLLHKVRVLNLGCPLLVPFYLYLLSEMDDV
jgi:hypothetical protein